MNLLADMGAQPGSLQIGADPSTPLIARDIGRRRATSVVTVAGRRRDGRQRRSRDHHRHGVRQRRRLVAGVEVSVDGGTTWHAAQGTSAWTYEWSPGAPGAGDDPHPRDRRQRQPETPGAGIDRVGRRRQLPVPDPLEPRRRCRRCVDVDDASPVELGLKFRSDVNGFVKGVRFYKGVGQHRDAHRQPVDEHRHAVGDARRSPARIAVRLAGSAVRRAGRDHREHDLRRVVSHQRRPLFGDRRLLQHAWASIARRCMRRRPAPSAATASTATAPARSRRRRSTPPTTGSTSSSTARRTRSRR